jgi:hypothetical protein
VKITKEIELQPFTVPNFVLAKAEPAPRQNGIMEVQKFHLSELSEETLNALCDEFREQVFKKAGK